MSRPQRSPVKTGTAKEVATASVGGETYYRLRDLATAVNRTAAPVFNVEWKNGVIVITGERYDTAALAPAAEATGVKQTLTMQVNGKTVTTAATDVNGNYYVPASLPVHAGHQGHGIEWHADRHHQVIFPSFFRSYVLSADSPRMTTHPPGEFSRFALFFVFALHARHYPFP